MFMWVICLQHQEKQHHVSWRSTRGRVSGVGGFAVFSTGSRPPPVLNSHRQVVPNIQGQTTTISKLYDDLISTAPFVIIFIFQSLCNNGCVYILWMLSDNV